MFIISLKDISDTLNTFYTKKSEKDGLAGKC